jgi:5-methylcytosine-specific restriction endonuclease McrA
LPFDPKFCENCNKPMILKSTRDILRKKYCSRSCRQLGRFAKGEIDMKKLWAKSCTSEANAKKGLRGELHPKFTHDRSLVKGRLRPETNKFRAEVFERDGHRCVYCGSTEKLVADHIKPYAHFPELRYDSDNGRALCGPCHKKTGTYALTKKALANSEIAKEVLSLIVQGHRQKDIAHLLKISEPLVSNIVNRKNRYGSIQE